MIQKTLIVSSFLFLSCVQPPTRGSTCTATEVREICESNEDKTVIVCHKQYIDHECIKQEPEEYPQAPDDETEYDYASSRRQ